MKKKVGLFLGAQPHTGGTFQYNQSVLEAVAALPADAFSVVVAYTSELWEEHILSFGLPKVLVPRGFWGRSLCYSLKKLGLPVRAWRRICPHVHPLARTLIPEQCDLWIFPSQDAWSFFIPVPALVSIHDLMHRYERRFPEVSARGEFASREFVYRHICRWAKGVLVDSAVGKQQVIESYQLDAKRIHVLPFIPPRYIYASDTPKDFGLRYHLPQKYIFYPAQFWEHKNHEGLIRAISELKGTLPDLKLVLAGSKKNAYEKTLRLVNDLHIKDAVQFLGYVPDEDIPEMYRRARALVMPTFFGPTNIPPLEAFAAGCPVAVSDIYGMPEQVGDAALLFDPKSVGKIAESIKKLWTDDPLCAELAGKGRQRAERWGQKEFNVRFRNIIGQVLSTGEDQEKKPAQQRNN